MVASASRNDTPIRALLISLAALAVPVTGAFWVPEAFADYEALLWLLAVVPAFLLSYYKGWRGVAGSLAGAMAVISVTYAITQATGHQMPQLMLPVIVIMIALFLGIGALAARFRRDIGADAVTGEGFTDPVTGLPNRAHAELHLQIEYSAALRGRPLAVVMFDIDNFKGYNQRHGEIAGDEVLRTLGAVLKKTTRRLNLTARYAGDEFICVLGGSDDDGAISFVNRFQQALREHAGHRPLPPISGGIASYTPSMTSHRDLISAAEGALRQAKKEGRGRVRVHGRKLNVPLAVTGGDDADESPAAVMPQGRGRGRKALIVAEQAPVRALLARYLTDFGFTVAQVSNVVDGVQCLTIEYDLLFTDISLHEAIGVELVRAAKLRWPSIQVVGLVHQTSGDIDIDALNAGVDRYLVTPLELPRVRAHITDLLARRDRLVTSVVESRQLSMEYQARANDVAEALRHSEEAYRSVIRSVHEVIFRTDVEGTFTALNDAWTKVTGYPVDASVGHAASDFVWEQDRAEFTAMLHALAAGNRTDARAEIRIVSVTGELRWFELRASRLFDAVSRVQGVTGTLEDVTARRSAEEALRASEAASRGLLAALPDQVIRLSRSGTSVEELFPESEVPRMRELMDRAIATTEVQVHEYRIVEGDELHEFEVRLAASDDDAVVAIVRDITDRKSLEAQLRQSQKLEAIGRLAGGLAHDFNNLLTVVQGNAHLLGEETQSSAPAREYVDQIATAAERGATLVRQLLAFGRRQVMQPTILDLNTIVEGTRGMLARLIGENILLEVDLEPDLGLIKADAGQIEQVLVNLAVNARDVLKFGGVLRVTTRNGALAPHGAEESRADDVVLLTVSDNGPGMDAQTRERIFEPFFTTKGLAHSSGLGLATVYGIVRQSGGTISVLSEPGRGTSFEIALPRIHQ